MRLPLFLFFTVTMLFSFAQEKETVLNHMKEYMCDCLNESEVEQLKTEGDKIFENCLQNAVDKNMDDLLAVYGDEVIQSSSVGETLSLEMQNKLENDCLIYDAYAAGLSSTEDEGYNEIQLQFIEDLSKEACDCSTEKVNDDPSAVLQSVLEECMQKTIFANIERLAEDFGSEVLTNQDKAYNIGVDIGNHLVKNCPLFNPATVGHPERSNTLILKGMVSSFKEKGDYIMFEFKTEPGSKAEFYITHDFEGRVNFEDNLKNLKKAETEITIYYKEQEVYFESEGADKKVNTLEFVEY
ncbi:MAG: hypothetical protein N4A46_10040 [Schleiferiaceae bacterium]|nr:hypothetical protein [Schleiferiaceae bacterium]